MIHTKLPPNVRRPHASRTACSLGRRAAIAAAGICLLTTSAFSQGEGGTLRLEEHWPPTLGQYLPEDQTYDAEFPKPESVLGWPVGTWHVRHDQLVSWFETVAAASPRFQLERYGETHEARPLILATVSSPENIARIDDIRENHVEAVRSGAESDDGPAVVWMGYGVHGNESSASNASLLLAYHLAAATDPEIEEFLANTIVLIDPCINPDGGARFAHWANMHKGQNLVGSPAAREHGEAWPGGRTNHYWFDLNRDWLLLTHPESRGRIAQFQDWLPTVLTDYHEMGSGSTYFFQPGIPTRRNPLTPESNHELTGKIAEYHARALDEKGSLYFTEERFDDFYYGKGSTYPDVHGAIGILFEQASSRGHLVETRHGELTFPFTIENQFTTSLTTLQAVDELRDELSAHQRGFYRESLENAANADVAGYVFGDETEPEKARELVRRLLMHEIVVTRAPAELEETTEAMFAVPAEQPQYQLVRALFETRTSWDDNTFYDVSSWTFPLSFGVWSDEVSRADAGSLEGLTKVTMETLDAAPSEEAPADVSMAAGYVLRWDSLTAPKAALHLMRNDVAIRSTAKPIAVGQGDAEQQFDRGSLIVTTGGQSVDRADVVEAVNDMQRATGVVATPIASGKLRGAPDLGSGSYARVDEPKVVLAVGRGVSAYEAGEMWHDLDTRMGLGVTLVERQRLGSMDLDDFTHVILVSGASSGWSEAETSALRDWVRSGGVLIATRRSALWAAAEFLSKAEPRDDAGNEEKAADDNHGDEDTGDENDEKPLTYEDYEGLRAHQRIAGTIFEVDVDTSHPIAFGMRETLPVFRNSESILPEGNDPFATPARYTESPLLSGFASEENVEKIAGTPAIRVERVGGGTVIAMIDNPVFRGVWYGTRPFVVNALFFGGSVGRTGPIGDRSADEEMSYDHGHEHDR